MPNYIQLCDWSDTSRGRWQQKALRTILRELNANGNVPCANWNNNKLNRNATSPKSKWNEDDRVLLLDTFNFFTPRPWSRRFLFSLVDSSNRIKFYQFLQLSAQAPQNISLQCPLVQKEHTALILNNRFWR